MPMHLDTGVTATVAAVTGVGSYVIQAVAAPNTLPIIALTVTILSTVVGGAIAWGMMKKTTVMLERDLRHLSGQMVELISRIATIEGELKARGR